MTLEFSLPYGWWHLKTPFLWFQELWQPSIKEYTLWHRPVEKKTQGDIDICETSKSSSIIQVEKNKKCGDIKIW
jgi:hypothetical protein